MEAIIQTAKTEDWPNKFNANIAAVISNKSDAMGLTLAKELGIQAISISHSDFSSREKFDIQLMHKIDTFEPDLIVLAGFMRILIPAFVAHYENRLINIHPSLLPEFTGLNTHQRAIEAGCEFSGATVHRVTSEVDVGTILARVKVRILASDNAKTLAARIQEQEHLIYPRAISQLLAAM